MPTVGRQPFRGDLSSCAVDPERLENRFVAERLVRFANVVGRDHVIAGTDCGFAQGPFVRRVHESIMWAKLDGLVEGARLASLELWGRTASVQP
jgi:methionine synthase II (cobalamin-independent)